MRLLDWLLREVNVLNGGRRRPIVGGVAMSLGVIILLRGRWNWNAPSSFLVVDHPLLTKVPRHTTFNHATDDDDTFVENQPDKESSSPPRLFVECATDCHFDHRKIVPHDGYPSVASSSIGDRIEAVGDLFPIHTFWHSTLRRDRFPSVEERVKLYMSNWYLPPCPNATKGMRLYPNYRIDNVKSWPLLKVSDPASTTGGHVREFDSVVRPDIPFLLDRRVIEDCARSMDDYNNGTGVLVATDARVERREFMEPYCTQVLELMDISDALDNNNEQQQQQGDNKSISTVLLVFFGDGELVHDYEHFDVPFFAKYRPGASQENVNTVTNQPSSATLSCLESHRTPLKTLYYKERFRNRMSPILWKVNSLRHWEPLSKAVDLKLDTPWEQKRDLAFCRFGMTGTMKHGVSDLEKCRSNQRCDFVLRHANSKLVDCGLISHSLKNSVINGTDVMKGRVRMRDFMSYKIIISLEGNDVASGLKWALQSESVVLMPPPTRTSWALEELMQPWIHYIPMLADGSNAEERVQWVLDNEMDARRIAERGTLFMYDLVWHPDAKEDDRKIKEEIVRRYRSLWH